MLYLINENLICLACPVSYFHEGVFSASVIKYLSDNIKSPVFLARQVSFV